ncbi:hypothetical protein, partial [Stenotrophomonas sp. GbtcB23]|uniref:hypothetical protein n=1 Tax=Stenotrophomonas sp. GbtcB23 TaxID=2824768 RepID=UPI001C2FABDD
DAARIRAWAADLLDLHRSTTIQAHSGLWSLASSAIARLIEALPDELHPPLLIEVFSLPLVPSSGNFRNIDLHEIDRWVDVGLISSACRIGVRESYEIQWEGIVEQLIVKLRTGPEPSEA